MTLKHVTKMLARNSTKPMRRRPARTGQRTRISFPKWVSAAGDDDLKHEGLRAVTTRASARSKGAHRLEACRKVMTAAEKSFAVARNTDARISVRVNAAIRAGNNFNQAMLLAMKIRDPTYRPLTKVADIRVPKFWDADAFLYATYQIGGIHRGLEISCDARIGTSSVTMNVSLSSFCAKLSSALLRRQGEVIARLRTVGFREGRRGPHGDHQLHLSLKSVGLIASAAARLDTALRAEGARPVSGLPS